MLKTTTKTALASLAIASVSIFGATAASASPQTTQQAQVQSTNTIQGDGFEIVNESSTSALITVPDGSITESNGVFTLQTSSGLQALANEVTTDAGTYALTIERVSDNQVRVITPEPSASSAESSSSRTDNQRAVEGWEGSWDQCVSKAMTTGIISGAVGGMIAAGPAAAAAAAAAGMITAGAVAVLVDCWGKPFISAS
ncbi:hypothetical protein C5E06_11575 [Pseudoclavibacter sp. RFBI5]|uniref:hypothetical protein n=1 Tax=Pseudoclavibacter sp. RFBI5 TaxID=2080578 RepID=UPI000CE87CEE|nr:hypothetical protein [Pseudoclavibacter sp. RFBI5]PPG03058.1 hypothetical protein C5E06_11575 [Pseudoclavibacter sp. RFBI5]